MKARVISGLALISALAVIIYGCYRVYSEYQFWVFCVYFVAVICGVPLCSVLHEAGHMLFGACVKIKAIPKFTSLRKFMGAASCEIKPETGKNLKGKIIFTAIGGLFVNFVFVVLGVIAFCVPAVPVYLSAFTGFSLYLFILNALPLNLYYGKTDGLVICELIKNEDTAKVMIAVLTIQAQVLNGKPFEKLDEKLLFDLPQLPEDDINFISLTQLRYEYFNARGDSEQAEKYLRRFVELKKEYM